MFFYIAKISWFFLQPSAFLLLLLAGCVLAGWRGAYLLSRRLAACGLALCLIAWSPVPNWLALVLEQRFSRADLSGSPVTGIVILGGAEDTLIGRAHGTHALNEAAERFTEAVALSRRLPQARVVFTGGTAALLPASGAMDGTAVREMLVDMGVAPERITTEDRSRNTWENAVFTKAMIAPKPGERWLLVTSAWHMPRSIGVFRAAGFDVEPWPVDYRTTGWDDFRFFPNPADGLRRLDTTFREFVGLAAYRMTGRSSALFPGPATSR